LKKQILESNTCLSFIWLDAKMLSKKCDRSSLVAAIKARNKRELIATHFVTPKTATDCFLIGKDQRWGFVFMKDAIHDQSAPSFFPRSISQLFENICPKNLLHFSKIIRIQHDSSFLENFLSCAQESEDLAQNKWHVF